MRAVGFIGLGTMGFPMAENLLKKGYSVIAYNRTSSKAEKLAGLGAETASTPRDVLRDADVVITMLGDDRSVEEVYYGSNGIFSGIRPGVTVIDSSTISPGLVRRIASDMEDHLADFLDAPVTGSTPAAIDGTLLFMVGGKSEALDGARDILSAMGRKIIHMGVSGSGAYAKLAHNAMVGIHAAALAEGLSIAAKSGIDPEKFLEIVRGGGANSRQAELKGDKILDRDFSIQFSLKFMLKDLILGSGLANDLSVPAPMLENAKSLFQMGYSKGLGDLDLSSVIQCYEDWIDLKVERRKADDQAAASSTAGAGAAGADAGEQDRRKKPRVPINIDLQISVYQWEQEGAFSGQQIDAQMYDLSEGGLQIRSKFPLAADMFVVIHFPREAELPPITAKVIRVTNDGDMFRYGCMLSGLPPYVRLKLEDYLRQKAAAAADVR
nr:NAD(P)-binding domain-containing protein [Paenibacillus alkalitolerans]